MTDLHDRIECAIARAGDAVFIDECPDGDGHVARRISFRQLRTLIPVLAASIFSQHGDRVAPPVCSLMIEDAMPLALAQVTCAACNVTFVPIDPRDPPQRQDELRRRAQCTATLTSAAVLEAVDTMLAQNPNVDAAEPGVYRVCVDSSAPCYIIHSSGTTSGIPKGIVIDRSQLISYCDALNQVYGIDATSRLVTLSSCTFDPSIGDCFCALFAGATLFTPTRRQILSDVTRVLGCSAGTHIISSPALWRSVGVDAIQPGGLSAQTRVALGGEPLPKRLVEEWRDRIKLHSIYGLTEGTIYQCLFRVVPSAESDDETIDAICTRVALSGVGGVVGPAFGGTRIGLLSLESDDDRHQLVIVGPQVARGYLRDDVSADAVGFSDRVNPFRGILPTGDVVVSVPFGAYTSFPTVGAVAAWTDLGPAPSPTVCVLGGRADFQVKVRGERVSLEEVEAAIGRNSALVQQVLCSVVGASLVACFTIPESSSVDSGEEKYKRYERVLGEICRATLSTSQCPAACLCYNRVAATLPQTRNGKMERRVVREWATDVLSGMAASTRTLDDVGVLVATVWGIALGRDVSTFDAESNFFFLGGDSLAALKATRELLFALKPALDNRGDLKRATSAAAARAAAKVTPPVNCTLDDFGVFHGPLQPALIQRCPTLHAYVAALADLGIHPTVEPVALDVTTAPVVIRNPPGAYAITTAIRECVASNDVNATRQLLETLARSVRCGEAEVLSKHTRKMMSQEVGLAVAGILPLHIAVQSLTNDVHEMISLLIMHGASPTEPNADHVTPLHLAAQRQSPDVLRMLIADKEMPDRRRGREETPSIVFVRDGRIQSLLHHAARAKAVAVLRYLTETYPALDVGARDRWQRTPMHWAVLSGDVETVRVLTESAMARYRAWANRNEGSILKATTAHDFNVVDAAPPFTVRTAAQLKRLSQQKTSLPYETLLELATRMHGASSDIASSVSEISLLIN